MVSHARGTMSAARIDEALPYQVAMFVPWNGLGARCSAILAWASARRCSYARQHRDKCLCMCFADAGTAAAFQAEFEGLAVVKARSRLRTR